MNQNTDLKLQDNICNEKMGDDNVNNHIDYNKEVIVDK